MKSIDVRQWDLKVRNALEDAAASGGAILELDDNHRVLVVDPRLWDTLQRQLPSLTEILKGFHRRASDE